MDTHKLYIQSNTAKVSNVPADASRSRTMFMIAPALRQTRVNCCDARVLTDGNVGEVDAILALLLCDGHFTDAGG